jgi:hypothetical protein
MQREMRQALPLMRIFDHQNIKPAKLASAKTPSP